LSPKRTSFPLTLDVDDAPHASVFTAFEEAVEWHVTVDSGVSDFDVTGTWTDTAWIEILADIVEDAGLCLSMSSTSHTVTLYNCP
jgi:hypothetical protein